MSDITVTVSDTQMKQLKEKAARLGISLMDLVLLSIEEILSRPDEDFLKAADYGSTEKRSKTCYLTALFGRKRTLFWPTLPFFRGVRLCYSQEC